MFAYKPNISIFDLICWFFINGFMLNRKEEGVGDYWYILSILDIQVNFLETKIIRIILYILHKKVLRVPTHVYSPFLEASLTIFSTTKSAVFLYFSYILYIIIYIRNMYHILNEKDGIFFYVLVNQDL